MSVLIQDKLAEVTQKIAEFQANEGGKWSENTVKTQVQQRKTIQSYLLVMSELLSNIEAKEVKMETAILDKFKRLTTLTEARAAAPIVIKEGDSLLNVMKKYSDRKFESIAKAADKAGLKLNGNKFVKA